MFPLCLCGDGSHSQTHGRSREARRPSVSEVRLKRGIVVEAAEKFKELVEKGSGGRIEVKIDAGTKAEIDINKMNRAGEIEMQSNGTNFLELYAPPYYFFTGPYVMKDFDHYMRAWNGKLGQAARAQLEKNDLKYLATIYRGLRQTTAKKPLYTPADAYNLKLRLPPIPSWMAVWKAIGTDPVGVPLPELYSSLKTGKAEASEGDLPQIQSFKLNEVQSHLIITNHLVQTAGILINKPFFDKLSKADQDLIVKAGKEAEEWANNKIKTGEAAILVDLQRKGHAGGDSGRRFIPGKGQAGCRRAVQDPMVGHNLG